MFANYKMTVHISHIEIVSDGVFIVNVHSIHHHSGLGGDGSGCDGSGCDGGGCDRGG